MSPICTSRSLFSHSWFFLLCSACPSPASVLPRLSSPGPAPAWYLLRGRPPARSRTPPPRRSSGRSHCPLDAESWRVCRETSQPVLYSLPHSCHSLLLVNGTTSPKPLCPSPSAPAPLPSLMLAEIEQHQGSTDKAGTAFHTCPYCLFLVSSNNKTTVSAGQWRHSYSHPLRRETKLSWLSTDLISCSINPTLKTEQWLTCQLPHGKPAPAAPQRNVSNPAAHCPAFLPYSGGFGDGSGWLLLRDLHSYNWITDYHICTGSSAACTLLWSTA